MRPPSCVRGLIWVADLGCCGCGLLIWFDGLVLLWMWVDLLLSVACAIRLLVRKEQYPALPPPL